MAVLAICPYCKGKHRTKKAFNRCKKKHTKPRWSRDGQVVYGRR